MGKGTKPHMRRREDRWDEHKQQLVVLVFGFQFFLRKIETHVGESY